MGQIQWTISLVMAGLFVIAILGFSIGFANDNSSPVSIVNDEELNNQYVSTIGNVSEFGNDAQDTYSSIVNTTISSSSASGTTQTAGQFAITPFNVINAMKTTLKGGYTRIFGTGSGFGIFITTLLGMIAFITGLLIWKTWAGRSPD